VIGPWNALFEGQGSAEPQQMRIVLPLRSLMARLNRQLKAWSLAVGPDGRVEARNVRCPQLRLSVEPTVQDHRVDVELCGVRWRRVHLNLPTWLRLRRIVKLPPLPLGVVVVAARRRGDAVDLRLTVPAIGHHGGD
jgi:hypothetical protein